MRFLLMKIDCLIVGAYETNCYILRVEQSKDCIIIDAGLEAGTMLNFLRTHKLNPVALILTHGHIDHIAAVPQIKQDYPDMKIYIHRLDADMLTEPMANLSAMFGPGFSTENADFLLKDKEIIDQVGIKLQVLHTPGHTPGGISLYLQQAKAVFTGDALFADSVGRTDFPDGNMEQLIDGIKTQLLTLPADTKVYPGHGPATTISREKKFNQYLQ
jgi:hydroxyacylglutathione hydrolase